jgi:hypothetical protein
MVTEKKPPDGMRHVPTPDSLPLAAHFKYFHFSATHFSLRTLNW